MRQLDGDGFDVAEWRRPRPLTTRAGSTSEAAQPSGAAIDFKHLARYTFGDCALEREILALYCEQSERLASQLHGAATQSDWGFAAHSLKGSARAVGAWEVAEIAARLERLAPDAPECEAELSALTIAMAKAASEALSR